MKRVKQPAADPRRVQITNSYAGGMGPPADAVSQTWIPLLDFGRNVSEGLRGTGSWRKSPLEDLKRMPRFASKTMWQAKSLFDGNIARFQSD